MRTVQVRIASVYLVALPFLAGGLTAVRPLRALSFRPVIGLALLASTVIALWPLAARWRRAGTELSVTLGVGGAFLVMPFTLIALMWTGLGTPWEATAGENQMRYLVLLAGLAGSVVGFVLVAEAARQGGESCLSRVALACSVLAGAVYAIWIAFQAGAWTARMRTGETPAAIASLNDALDLLEYAACMLTYLATVALALAMCRARLLGGRVCVTVAFVSGGLAALLSLRGLSFPDPTAASTPWFIRPGFIAGIPAVPWVVPHILGVLSLRRAGEAI